MKNSRKKLVYETQIDFIEKRTEFSLGEILNVKKRKIQRCGLQKT